MPADYDVSQAYKRIENELIDSMMRNLDRHRAEELKEGLNWEQWQVVQLKELERYRLENLDKFTDDFKDIHKKVDNAFWGSYQDGETKEEAKILEQVLKGKVTEGGRGVNQQFFGVNSRRVNALVDATKADFTRGEHALLRTANDQYRKIIFNAQMYSATGATYEQAVDMATKDFLKNGIQCITYKNGAKHNIQSYSRMAVKTGQKRAYLMGEGNANDKYGIHTVRVNKRTDACPYCVGWLGKVLVDDVYSGGTLEEAQKLGVPTLSEAMDMGFLHPNCKDVYSLYIEGVSRPADPYTKEEIQKIADNYNADEALRRAEDMQDSYDRMAKYSLDPVNQARYQARADAWGERVDVLKAGKPAPPIEPPKVEPPVVEPPKAVEFTADQEEAIEWYVSGDGMWINDYLRKTEAERVAQFGELSDNEKWLYEQLKSATDKPLDKDIHTLYRSVDSRAIFGDIPLEERFDIGDFLMYGDGAVEKGKIPELQKRIDSVKGKTITDKGFMSTTKDLDLAVDFDGFTGAEHSVVLELDTTKASVKGADLKKFDVPDAPQKEVLLAPDTKYKITDITVEQSAENGKFIKVKAEIIDEATAVAETAVAEEATATVEFVEAKTIKEAEAFARDTLGIDASFKGIDVKIANEMNEATQKALEFAPSIKDEMVRIGSAQEANKLLKADIVEWAVRNGYPEEYGKRLASRSVGRVTNVYALARRAPNGHRFEEVIKNHAGIFVNTKYGKTAEEMEKHLKADVASKFHPVGCDTVKSVIDHELGHKLDWALGIKENDEIKALWSSLSKAEKTDGLSKYATYNIKEFIAEGYSEYMNNPEPREIARKIGEIIEKMAKEKAVAQ